MIDVSIIIVNWNTCNLLLDCIESIYDQTKLVNFEIILVDNNSVDDSVKCVKSKYPEVRIIENERNEGFAKANNIGVDASVGRYVLLSNTDIKVLDSAVDKMVAYMDSNPRIGSLLPKCLDGAMNLRKCCRDFPNIRNLFCESFFLNRIFPNVKLFKGRELPDTFYLENGAAETMPCCFMIMRRETLEDVGVLDDSFFFYGEDVDWCKRCKVKGWDVFFHADSKVIHYGGSSTKATPYRFYKEQVKATIRYWRKHHSSLQVKLCVFVYMLQHVVRSIVYFGVGFFQLMRLRVDFANFFKHFRMIFWLIFKGYDEI